MRQSLQRSKGSEIIKNPKKSEGTGGRTKKVQGTLGFTSDRNFSETSTCKECGMSYYKYINKDQELHQQYHKAHLNGIAWVLTGKSPNESTANRVLLEYSIVRQKQRISVNIIAVNKNSDPQIRRVQEVLKMVNLELNASDGSSSWSNKNDDVIRANAFLALIDNKVVGVCTTEAITDPEKQARWMIHKSQTIVPDQINRRVKVGISRIWIAPKWRNLGIAKRLLEVTLNNSIYGVKLSKSEVAFSQPSTSGGLLAKSFNGVVHKSGETLLSVYLE